ncbi:PREDICTED: uncharacterized protein LOC104600883 [Nelumbo nucifera]|uniref:DNL-type domain-containing protein n=2 Tax=Nelumbo nucifera TaxID=4432 RepID=A0A822YM06_NELNU|nr:PREDICTED: uncharacterized protein LOC104600883 [Nelumbo nucifera]DAD35204.1 TPA_asm: hypothetical protein HUJ06_005844 [Nelumbo nucifera]
MAATVTPAISLLIQPNTVQPRQATILAPTRNFLRFNPESRKIVIFPSSRILSHRAVSVVQKRRRALEDDIAELPPPEENYIDDTSLREPTIDIKLPRRSLLVQFTCNACGERSQRLVNRLAYERGTVFVQCAGCLQHHKLVDNLGLVVEYDLREDISTETTADQV